MPFRKPEAAGSCPATLTNSRALSQMGRPTPHKRLMTGFDSPSAHHTRGETMRVVAEYDADQATPLLRFFIHGAPHRRIHQAVLKQYRRALWDAGREAQIPAPLRNNVEP